MELSCVLVVSEIIGGDWMKKYRIYYVLALLSVFMYFSFHAVSVTPEETIAHYKERWGVEMPIPDEINDIWSTKYPAHGDGEWVTEFKYEITLLPEQLNDFTKVTEENISLANGFVNKFLNRVKNIYSIQRDDTFNQTIEPYSIDLKLGDYYFHHSENGDFDTFTGIYQQQENRILVFEWHQ